MQNGYVQRQPVSVQGLGLKNLPWLIRRIELLFFDMCLIARDILSVLCCGNNLPCTENKRGIADRNKSKTIDK